MLTTSDTLAVPAAIDTPATCFVCGGDNPRGLRIRFRIETEGRSLAHWQPGADWEGFHGIIHGGIVSTVLDEAMSKAVASIGCHALTAELRVRFRHPVHSGRGVSIRGTVIDRNRRRIRAEASLTDRDGQELAHSWGVFLIPPDGGEPGDTAK